MKRAPRSAFVSNGNADWRRPRRDSSIIACPHHCGGRTYRLKLACEGKVTQQPEGKPEPIAMGIIVNFSHRTVLGFGFSGTIKITSMNEAIIAFEGSDPKALTQVTDWGIRGIVDRVTGILEATSTMSNLETHEVLRSTVYSLKCKPTQRMF